MMIDRTATAYISLTMDTPHIFPTEINLLTLPMFGRIGLETCIMLVQNDYSPNSLY